MAVKVFIFLACVCLFAALIVCNFVAKITLKTVNLSYRREGRVQLTSAVGSILIFGNDPELNDLFLRERSRFLGSENTLIPVGLVT